ncbi:nuclear transport factor 2 family protein [Shewanella acanthi]|uniref:nuclear transport factor 2 family protein n=1 Tax=Shewanella acanthi TaxID=2864212 RepID=UPI001C658DE7|nr:nuclear transport factor 2 family protein [Shewanella acanthi]MCH1928677.1 ester cyclase [Shewanella shenzhenensis]QYJ78007.1 ester cyclase [Shewanella acanthi]
MRILWLLVCLMFVPSVLAAQANSGEMPEEQQLAVKYITALTEHDYRTLSKFYNRDSVFYDKTANRKYTGGRFIIDFLERAHEGVLEYTFNIEHMYNAGPLVVMIGNYHFKGPGEQFGKPGKIIDVAIPGVTSIKLDMRSHRVTEHVDLIDYQTMSDQLALQ